MILNLHNVEDLIFYNDSVKKLLPEYNDVFNSWAFSKQHLGFRQLTRRTLSDFLSRLEEKHLDILTHHFKTKVIVDKMNYQSVCNLEFENEDVELLLNDVDNYNFDIYRDANKIYFTFWR